MTIDWKEVNAKEQVDKVLDRIAQNEDIAVRIINIVSSDFCETYGIDGYDDCNGWQLDWWATFNWKGTIISVAGCAWYGTIELYLD